MRSIRVLMMLGLLAMATGVRAQAPPQIPRPESPAAQPKCQNGVCAPVYGPAPDGPPRIDWKRGCARPICNPCDLRQWDYYDKCWTPWPAPANWTNSNPPPALATPTPLAPPKTPALQPSR